MDRFKKGVPFDPGYSKHTVSFIENIVYLTGEYINLKDIHKKKFKLSLMEPVIIKLINKCSAFYLGCILWGGYIYYRFEDNPKEILGNNTQNLTEDELRELDCAKETKYILKYIEQFDKDCKYFLRKAANVQDSIIEILNNYNEFVELNTNFINIDKTSDVRLPQALDHFKNLTDEQLDNLYFQILDVIESGNLENILKIGFYRTY